MTNLLNSILKFLSSTNDVLGYLSIAGFVMLIIAFIGDPKIFKHKKMMMKWGLTIVSVYAASAVIQVACAYLLLNQ